MSEKSALVVDTAATPEMASELIARDSRHIAGLPGGCLLRLSRRPNVRARIRTIDASWRRRPIGKAPRAAHCWQQLRFAATSPLSACNAYCGFLPVKKFESLP